MTDLRPACTTVRPTLHDAALRRPVRILPRGGLRATLFAVRGARATVVLPSGAYASFRLEDLRLVDEDLERPAPEYACDVCGRPVSSPGWCPRCDEDDARTFEREEW